MSALTVAAIRGALAARPRVELASVPTPLQPADRLGAALGLDRLYVKRDDLTGSAFGGNKVRQMEYVLGAALAAGADTLIAGGSVDQSNHARVAAATARSAGLAPLIVVRPGGRHPGAQGNGLLTRLLAHEVIELEALRDAPAGRLEEVTFRREHFERLAAERRAGGARPYVMVGTSTPLATLGYVGVAAELVEQTRALGIERPTVAVTSTGATQAGLELGNRLLGSPLDIVGLAYHRHDGEASAWVADLATRAADLLGIDLAVDAATVTNIGSAFAEGYGVVTPAQRSIMQLAIRSEGLLLDPVYTATGLASLQALVAAGGVDPSVPVIFTHTGGLPAIFAYADDVLRGGVS